MAVIKAVLIDTWWNVNRSCGARLGEEPIVLIDTWWNVNEDEVLTDALELLF